MKNRIFTLLVLALISLSYVSCSQSTTENDELYEQGNEQAIDKDAIKQEDIG